jgi:hypothetical protein
MVSGRSILGGIHCVKPGERKTAGKKRTEGERGWRWPVDVWRERQLKASQPAKRRREEHTNKRYPSGEFPFQVAGRLLLSAPQFLVKLLPRTTSSPLLQPPTFAFSLTRAQQKLRLFLSRFAAHLVRIPLSHLESAARLAMPRLESCEMRSRLITPTLSSSIRSLVH